MTTPGSTDELMRLAIALACALAAGMLVRSATVVTSQTLGQVWPFSLVRCMPRDAPGCRVGQAGAHRIPWP